MPDKEEKKKEVDQLSLGEEKDAGAGEDIVFQIQVQQYRCSNLDANCCCYFPLFIYIKMQAIIILEFIGTCQLFLSFLLVGLVWMVRVRAVSF